MIARHLFEIDKGMERVFAHSPHMPASAIPKNYADTSKEQQASTNSAGFTQSNTKSCKSNPTSANHQQAAPRFEPGGLPTAREGTTDQKCSAEKSRGERQPKESARMRPRRQPFSVLMEREFGLCAG